MSGDSRRATVQVPQDAVLSPDPVNNNRPETDSSASETQPPQVVIGTPAEGFNIYQMMVISHNYFEKVSVDVEDGSKDVRAKCLMCWQDKKEEVLLKMADGNLRGQFINERLFSILIFYF